MPTKAQELRKEFRLLLRDYFNLRRCTNCKYLYPNHDMDITKARELVEAYIVKKEPKVAMFLENRGVTVEECVRALRRVKDLKEIKNFIESFLPPEIRSSLVGEIFDGGEYCIKLGARVRQDTFALACEYFERG